MTDHNTLTAKTETRTQYAARRETGADQRRVGGMYRVMYWDAHGDAHVTEKMDKAKAETARDSMSPSQEARLVFVK